MSIKNLAPRVGPFKQGYFNPRNPEKYVGDVTSIIYRSSWEFEFMVFCDSNESVVAWASEPIAIPYFHPFDRKVRSYHVDFMVGMQGSDGEIKQYLIEIKPNAQNGLMPKPELKGRKTAKKLERHAAIERLWEVNRAKFQAAQEFADRTGREFKVCGEEYFGRSVKS